MLSLSRVSAAILATVIQNGLNDSTLPIVPEETKEASQVSALATSSNVSSLARLFKGDHFEIKIAGELEIISTLMLRSIVEVGDERGNKFVLIPTSPEVITARSGSTKDPEITCARISWDDLSQAITVALGDQSPTDMLGRWDRMLRRFEQILGSNIVEVPSEVFAGKILHGDYVRSDGGIDTVQGRKIPEFTNELLDQISKALEVPISNDLSSRNSLLTLPSKDYRIEFDPITKQCLLYGLDPSEPLKIELDQKGIGSLIGISVAAIAYNTWKDDPVLSLSREEFLTFLKGMFSRLAEDSH